MAWRDWLKGLFGGYKPPDRNVAGLIGDDPELISEAIDTSGSPLKPFHRRRALRDKRLLPKAPSALKTRWPLASKPKYLSADEARRLFSATQLTRDRSIRDLATDEEQLVRYGLPLWHSEGDVAVALGLSLKQLRHFSIHRQRETTSHYVTFALPKRSGGVRLIHAPKQRLRAIQRKLLSELVSKLPLSAQAHGFVPGRSIATNARPHVGRRVVIKLDLKDCFPSIHFGRVRSLLIAYGYSYPVATSIAVLATEAPRQLVEAEGRLYHVPVGPRVCVQGAPTSPHLCNAIMLRLDRRIAGLARKHGYGYTRYADDLTLSGDDPGKIKLLLTLTAKICREEGFQINQEKTRVMRRRGRQQVTGVTVNEQLGLSRTERRKLRAAIHQLDPVDTRRRRQLAGRVAYLAMLNPDQAAPLRRAMGAPNGSD